jgi:DNA repair exonuclease SbcCD ATPase subunit
MIDQVSAQNLKGQTFSHELKPVTLVTGGNGTGKSTRLLAIQLALCGYVPEEPPKKPLKDAREIFDQFGSGPDVWAEVVVGGKRRRQRWFLTGLFKPGAGTVTSSCDSDPCFPNISPEAADPSSYLTLTGPQKLDYLLRKTSATSGLSVEKMEESILKNLGRQFDYLSSKTETAAAIKSFVEHMTSLSKAVTVPTEWLAQLLESTKAKEKSAKETVQRLQKTLQGLAATRSADLPDPSSEAKLAQAREALIKAEARLVECTTQYAYARQQWREASEETKALAADPEKLSRILNEAQETNDQAVEKVTEQQVREAWGEWEKAIKAQATAEMMVATHKEALKRAERAQCPDCGQKIPKAKRKASGCTEEKLREMLKTVEEAERNCTADIDLKHKAKEELSKQKETAEAHKELQELASEMKRLVAVRQSGETLKASSLDLEVERNQKRQRVTELEESVKLLTKVRAESAQQATVTEQLQKAEEEKAVYKELVGLLSALREQMVERAIGPLVEKVNRLCHGLIPDKVRFEDGELVFGRGIGRSASDSEKMALSAALALALASDSPLKVAVVGRFESFDSRKQAQLVATALDMIHKKELDQCILINVGPCRLPMVDERMGVIDL